MTWFSGVLVYIVLWWLAFFMMLPWGARSFHEAGEAAGAGNAESAPVRPRVGTKALAATAAAAVLWLVAWRLIDGGVLSFRP